MLVSIGDTRLFVDVDGPSLVPDGSHMHERPTLIMLHGGPGFDHTVFKQPVFAPLTQVAQVVYYDHRGNGRSDRSTPDRWNLDTWADDLHALCNVLGIERPVVYGASFGGFVALNYALRHPEQPSKLILSSTAAHIHLERSFVMFERFGGPEAREVAERFWRDPIAENFEEYRRVCLPLYTQREQPQEVHARVTHRLDVAAHFRRSGQMRFDFREEVQSIRCPVLVMAGLLDPMVTIDDARELAAALPPETTQILEFENAGHMLPLEEPEAVIAAITKFIATKRS
jgi:pimeloyl-ACP methyl ester carboxylesterase